MHSITAREARKNFSALLNEAEQGSIVSITRRGQEVARIVPPETVSDIVFPDLNEFRDAIKVEGKPTSRIVTELRDEERY
ncbi:MAG: hypothetical protein DRP70_15465 [Spirochaetes bacterium]|nr:MAG: hypothetical protein DRP70_15465 [Spirochaetota bacterium]